MDLKALLIALLLASPIQAIQSGIASESTLVDAADDQPASAENLINLSHQISPNVMPADAAPQAANANNFTNVAPQPSDMEGLFVAPPSPASTEDSIGTAHQHVNDSISVAHQPSGDKDMINHLAFVAEMNPPAATSSKELSNDLHHPTADERPLHHNLMTLVQMPFPTYQLFCDAIDAYSKTRAGGHPKPPSKSVYDSYMRYVASEMNVPEQAMFLANIIWETTGLQDLDEKACKSGTCPYGNFYGRGYIHLTWDYNYRSASMDLYGDDRLVKNPNLVSEPEGAWKTALWYWRTHVRPRLVERDAIDNFLFGYAIMAINGAVECVGAGNDTRLTIYNAILFRWSISYSNPGRMTGCGQ